MSGLHHGVRGGTPVDAPSLCRSCASSSVVKGMAESQEFVRCHALDLTVTFKVVECSSYRNKSDSSLHDMETIAWILVTKGINKPFGFISAKEFKKDNDYESPLSPDIKRNW